MSGRIIQPERVYKNSVDHLGRPDLVRRREILWETIDAFTNTESPDRYHCLAKANLDRWASESSQPHADKQIHVVQGDWGEVTQDFTQQHGKCFAVLNMANAHVPGGGYVEGMPAQEENMFRRTDCHFQIGPDEYDSKSVRYLPQMTALLEATDGAVYLDIKTPRVCIRGPEDRSREDLGYAWLAQDEVFAFIELRASAQDLRDGSAFDKTEARRRIAAQLDTLRQHKVRHAVLSAFGCGAFRNPAGQVAQIYREEIDRRHGDFSVIVFAIFSPGYGPDNFAPFARAFAC